MTKILLLVLGIALAAALLLSSRTRSQEPEYSTIKSDETLLFFRTAASFDDGSQAWNVPLHGWVYEAEDSVARRALFETVLERQFELRTSAETEANFARRLNLLIADNERGKQIVVEVAGQTYALPQSGVNGHFSTTLSVPFAEVEKHRAGGRLEFSAVLKDGDRRQFGGDILLIAPEGFAVISDIDDTVKISEVTDRRKLLENTFLLDFRAAPGMSGLYNQWSADLGASFHYVSSSPWQLYSPLIEFLADKQFPAATLSLKTVRFRDETLLDLFKKGTETKPLAIEEILNAFPQRQFVLVGDSGEQDPEVYATLAKKHAAQIAKVFIRNVTGESADNERFTTLFADISEDRWQLFDDPASVTLAGPQ